MCAPVHTWISYRKYRYLHTPPRMRRQVSADYEGTCEFAQTPKPCQRDHLLEGRLHEVSCLPKICCQAAVRVTECLEASCHEIALDLGVTVERRETVGHIGKRQHLLAHWRFDNVGSVWCIDQAHLHRSAFAMHFQRHGMRDTDSSIPVSTSNWNQPKLGNNGAAMDCGCHLLGVLGTKSADAR